MEEMEGLDKLLAAFLRTAKNMLRDLLARKYHPNGDHHCPPNGGTPPEPRFLPTPQEEPLWESLTNEGLRLERVERFALGWMDHPEAMAERLLGQGFSAETLRKSKLLADRRLAGRFIGPIQTASGRIVSFWARSTGAEKDGPRYLYWRPDWKGKVPAVWLPTALLRGGRKKGLLVVEDIWEALQLQMAGFLRTVGLGESGQPIPARRLAQFAQLHIPSLTVALNRTADFPTRLARLRETFQQRAWPFQLWILPPEALGPYSSPAEFLQHEGAKAFQNLLSSQRMAVERLPIAFSPEASSEAQQAEAKSASSSKDQELSEPTTAKPPKICPLHHCLETECFCFD